MILTIRAKTPATDGNLTMHGFPYFWVKYVHGVNLNVHCANCLKGPYSRRPGMRYGQRPFVNHPYILDESEAPFVYVCGVTGNWNNNLHIALRPDPHAEPFAVETHNGYVIGIEGATRVEIPELPRGYHDLPDAFTTCRNFQFAVAYQEQIEGISG